MLSILTTSAVETSSDDGHGVACPSPVVLLEGGEDAAFAVEAALVEAGARDDDKACRGVVATAVVCFVCRSKVRSRDRSILV